jgi:outer membrane protein TolC
MNRRRLGWVPAVLGVCFFSGVGVSGVCAAEVDGFNEAALTPGRVLDLQTCVEFAVVGNSEVRQASQAFADAEGKAIGFRAVVYPTAQVQAISTPPTFYLQLEQVLVDRSIGPRLELARLARKEAALHYQNAIARAIFRTRQAFVLALAQEAKVAVLEAHLVRADGFITQGRQLFEAGRIQRADVARMEVRAGLVRQQLEAARTLRHQALLELGEAMGRGGAEGVRLSGTLGEEQVPGLDVAALAAQALETRPDLRFLRHEQLTRGQQLLLSTQSLYPRLALTSKPVFQPVSLGEDFDINRNDNEPSIRREEGNSQLPVGVQLTWSFFDGGRSLGQRQSAEARLASQGETVAALEAAIPGEIQRTVAALEAARTNLEFLVLPPTVEQLRSTAEADYESGRIRLLDKAQADDFILARQQSVVEARLAYSLSAAALDFTLGRIVQFSARP